MEICDEIKTFVMACQATASPWIYYSALYAMAIHPDVQDRLFEEICKHSSTDSDIFLEQVEKMEYFNLMSFAQNAGSTLQRKAAIAAVLHVYHFLQDYGIALAKTLLPLKLS
jgi:cytochrome P450